MNKVIALLITAFVIALIIDSSRNWYPSDWSSDIDEWRNVEQVTSKLPLKHQPYEIKGNSLTILMNEESCGLSHFYKLELSKRNENEMMPQPKIIKVELSDASYTHAFLFDKLDRGIYELNIKDNFGFSNSTNINISDVKFYKELKKLLEEAQEEKYQQVYHPLSSLIKTPNQFNDFTIIYTQKKSNCIKEIIKINYENKEYKINFDKAKPSSMTSTVNKDVLSLVKKFEQEIMKKSKTESPYCFDETIEVFHHGERVNYTNSSCEYSIDKAFKALKKKLNYPEK